MKKFPFGFLTMLVSLEAIFLSTFVMISQNRADDKRARPSQGIDGSSSKPRTSRTKELLALLRQTLELTKEIHPLTEGSKATPS